MLPSRVSIFVRSSSEKYNISLIIKEVGISDSPHSASSVF